MGRLQNLAQTVGVGAVVVVSAFAFEASRVKKPDQCGGNDNRDQQKVSHVTESKV